MTNHELHDYRTGEYLRMATEVELAESLEQAKHDSGGGVIGVEDFEQPVYVTE